AARDFRIHPAQHQGAAVGGDDLEVLRAARVAGRTDIVLAALAALELQLLQLGAVGEVHHDATVRPARDLDRLAALAARRRCGARKIGVLVKRAIAPAADDLFRTVLRRDRRL